MSENQAEAMAQELLSVLDEVGRVDRWISDCCEPSIDPEIRQQACLVVTEALLGTRPPQTGHWEQLLVALATFSLGRRDEAGLQECKAMMEKASELLERGVICTQEPSRIVTLATAMTLVLTAQKKLRQAIEQSVASICTQHEDLLPEIAERCQDIWKRQGQMSGEQGLFLWDLRREAWRLAQDFKWYRPDAS